MNFDTQDYCYMAEALKLAEKGRYSTHPNPRVGCLIVNDNAVVGRGWHKQAGGPHAEIEALNEAGDQANGATCYVTLEPCCHYGRTGPCVKALIEMGIKRVVIAMEDPNPQVFGEGIAQLTSAGVQVQVGLMREQSQNLNKGFISRMQRKRPYVRCKLAMSIDGRTAMASGESQWITGPEARADVQRLRGQSDAIITGCGTVLTDEPSMQVRWQELEAAGDLELPLEKHDQPMRVVFDSQLKVSPRAKIFSPPGVTLVVTSETSSDRYIAYENRGISVEAFPAKKGVDIQGVLTYLSQRQINEVLLEAGSTLSGAFLQAQMVDEVVIYMASTLMGSSAKPLFELPIDTMGKAVSLEIQEITAVGQDWRISAYPRYCET